MKSLLELLENNNGIPMHMPGHKRNTALAPYLKRLAADLDITEISGFDNLHDARGILKESMEKAAEMRSADRAFYLVNGATGGILAAICALVSEGDKVICARNCHKAVYNALELAGAEPVFVMPRIDEESGICKQLEEKDIKKALAKAPNARLVIVTSPTYEGVVSDIKGICRAAHDSGVPVFVDAAHGAHFGFGHGFPEDAVSLGADVVVESLHKTLPSLTQTAVCYSKKQFADKLEKKLAVFQTSSPSYLLMASMDGCVRLLSEHADELFAEWRERLDCFYEACADLKNIKLLKKNSELFDLDPSKLVMRAYNGKWLSDRLREKSIECEMSARTYAVAMTGPGDTKEMLSYLAASLHDIDKNSHRIGNIRQSFANVPEGVMSAREVEKQPVEYVSTDACGGRTAAGYVWAYPPGIPIVAPGERISDVEVNIFKEYAAVGIELSGSAVEEGGKILVIK